MYPSNNLAEHPAGSTEETLEKARSLAATILPEVERLTNASSTSSANTLLKHFMILCLLSLSKEQLESMKSSSNTEVVDHVATLAGIEETTRQEIKEILQQDPDHIAIKLIGPTEKSALLQLKEKLEEKIKHDPTLRQTNLLLTLE